MLTRSERPCLSAFSRVNISSSVRARTASTLTLSPAPQHPPSIAARPIGSPAHNSEAGVPLPYPNRRRMRVRKGSCTANKPAATRISNATSARNSRSPVFRNRTPPITPPIMPAGRYSHSRRLWPRRSSDCARAAPGSQAKRHHAGDVRRRRDAHRNQDWKCDEGNPHRRARLQHPPRRPPIPQEQTRTHPGRAHQNVT